MDKHTTKDVVWSWEAIAACCCFVGGMGTGLVGCLVTAVGWILGGPQHPWVRGLGTALLIVTIPLLILSGYCMDWMEREADKRAKGSSWRRSQEGIVS